MEERTRAYLRGRFRDYYRRHAPTLPPAADRREWGYVPWREGGTTMIRHRSLLELGDLAGFLADERPRHVYFSAGRYRDPSVTPMGAKDWLGSDLVFDLDADHLPAVDPDADSLAEMLAACKDELRNLLDFLVDDFAFSDPDVVFSGGRGYHVHVRDPDVRELDRGARREIVDYVRGIGVEFDDLVETAPSGTATRRTLRTDGGWGRRAHRRLVAFLDDLAELPDDEARDALTAIDRIGEKRADAILRTIAEDRAALESGAIERGGPGIRTLAEALLDRAKVEETAAIDEPVTTDIHRLIRLPGSLHGGTALRVTPVDIADLDDFEPLADAVPDAFRNHEVRVTATGGDPVTLAGETFTVPDGDATLPEHVALFLMAGGRAEKQTEA